MMSRNKSKKAKNKRDKKREKALSFVMNIPDDTLQSPWDRGYSECPCPKKCTLHGECLLCEAYHTRKCQLAHCEK
jgi:hypothetical protein